MLQLFTRIVIYFIMTTQNLEDILNNQNSNINAISDRFYKKVCFTVSHHAPMKKVNKKQLKFRSKPRVTPHIQKPIKHRDKVLRKLKKSHSENTKELYKKFRNRAVSENRKSKINYLVLISKLIN